MQVVDICFAINDSSGRYCKYLGVALLSLVERTHAKIRIHILHDDTLSKKNKRRLIDTVKSGDNEIIFYYVDSSRFSTISSGIGMLTVGTLYRLMIAEILPKDVNKVIYLDADIVVYTDIKSLWEIPLEGNLIAGCQNKGLSDLPYPCKMGFVRAEEYFNAGVLVFDLMKIRRCENLLEKAVEYLKKNPKSKFWDQDALNVIFVGRVKYLPEKFNCFTYVMRDEADAVQQGIVHFAGDYVHTIEKKWFDELFFEIWEKSAWWNLEEVLSFHNSRENVCNQKQNANEALTKAVVEKRNICVWGANSVLKNKLLEKYGGTGWISFYVDSNKKFENTLINGKKVVNPNNLWQETRKPFVVVLSKKYFQDIGTELDTHGYKMNDDYINGSLLFSFKDGGVFPGL